MTDQIHGLTLEDCAEIMGKHTELTAQHGEPAFQPHFAAFLASRGIDENTWAQGWNGWWARLENDPSGELHAKYATLTQKAMMGAHFADVPDASQDAKEGVTLEVYAEIMAKIAGGEDAETVLADKGLPMDQWLKAQEGWNAAMAADVNHHLTTQYGTLYAKYMPNFQADMEAQVAAHMAADYAEREEGRDDEPEKEYTFDDIVSEMEDAKPRIRWSAAHHMANSWDIGDKSDAALNQAARRAVELLIECLERHDGFTVSEAEAAGNDLFMFAAEGFLDADQANDANSSIGRCLERAKEQLSTLETAFAPIRDKAVPERVKMQSQIQDYTSLVEELTEKMEEWDDNLSEPDDVSEEASAPSSAAPPSTTVATTAPAPSADNPVLAILRGLPVIGDILKALGL